MGTGLRPAADGSRERAGAMIHDHLHPGSTSAIAVPFAVTGRRRERGRDVLRLASGAISILFGVYVAWRIGIVDGLFTGHPTWMPG